ncbi:Calx-beta domain-containing protein [Candidatus Poriferisodalis sp.]|uniref:Calx-beta domain-containing protein n=1 Tax=Candidatus Poriferisodalis sp. TaxID=3101277 RepID=UPI003B515920
MPQGVMCRCLSGSRMRNESGSVSLEIVLLVPVLVLLTLFVLWAGRGGQVALIADLAAEEAATVAALCCAEDEAGASEREQVVGELLDARPNLGFLCIGGARALKRDGSTDPELVREQWLAFEPGHETGGVGVLDIGFACETDGAVAPLRGLFPTVTVWGQATEVVPREPRNTVGFSLTAFSVEEDAGQPLVFEVVAHPAPEEEVTLSYRVATVDRPVEVNGISLVSTVELADFEHVTSFDDLTMNIDGYLTGRVVIAAGATSTQISVPVVDDDFFEGDEGLTLQITGAVPLEFSLDDANLVATGTIVENDREPFLQIRPVSSGETVEGGPLAFEVRLGAADGMEAASAETVMVTVSTVDDPAGRSAVCPDGALTATDCWASAPSDYEAQSVVLTFERDSAANPLTQTFTVQTLDDDTSPEGETDEYVLVELSAPAGAPIHVSRGAATGKILDDEALLSVTDASAFEGDDIDFTITLSPAPAADVVVSYELTDIDPGSRNPTATRGDACDAVGPDYPRWPASTPGEFTDAGTVTFASGETSKTITVATCEDSLVELDESFWLNVSVVSGEAVVPDPYGAFGTIVNDDIPVVEVTNPTAEETEGALTFNISLKVDGQPAQLAEDVTVDYETQTDEGAQPDTQAVDGPACSVAGTDYLSVAATTLTFSGIRADDPTTPDIDESAPATGHDVEVTVCDDGVLEQGSETFLLVLSNPSLPDLLDGNPNLPATGTIDDISPLDITIDDPIGPEGSQLEFTITLVNARSDTVAVLAWETSPRTARQARSPCDPLTENCNFDYEPASGRFTLTESDPVITVSVQTLFDEISEQVAETFAVNLTLDTANSVGISALDDTSGTGSITNVNVPTLRVNDPTAVEGDPLVFTIALQNDDGSEFDMSKLQGNVVVDYEVQERSTDDAATPNDDYDPTTVPPSPGIFTFQPNGTDKYTVRVDTTTDGSAEGDETLALVIRTDTDYATSNDTLGIGTIIDAPPPTICISDARPVREGRDAVFTVTLERDGCSGVSATSTENITFSYTTGDIDAQASQDYVSQSGDVTFLAGDDRTTLRVTTLMDDIWELPERFRVDLSNPVNAVTYHPTAIGTIRADCIDADSGPQDPPVITVYPESGPESTLQILGRVSLSRPLCGSFRLELRLVAGTDADGNTGTPADPDDDFDTVSEKYFVDPTVSVEHAAAVSEKPVFEFNDPWGSVGGLDDDDRYENDEYFYVEVKWDPSMRRRYRLVDWVSAKYTIIDDDEPPSLRVTDAAAQAGDPIRFEVTLASESELPIEVEYRTVDITALSVGANPDYTGEQNWTSLTFDPLVTSAFVEVQTAANAPDETDETFLIEFRNAANSAVNARIDDGIGVGTILAGAGPLLSIHDATADEGDLMEFRVELSEPATQPITVQFATVAQPVGDGVATEVDDYTPRDGTLTFDINEDAKIIDVATIDDGITEVPETFLVELSNQTAGVSLADPSAVGTIASDVPCIDRSGTEPMPHWSLSGAEGTPENAGPMELTITLDEPLCQNYEFLFQVSSDNPVWHRDSTATFNADFLQPTSVTLAALDTQASVDVELIDDEIAEQTEQFRLRVWSGTPPVTGMRHLAFRSEYPQIIDNDVAKVQLPAAGDVQTDEGGFLSFVVRLDRPASEPISFDYVIADGLGDPSATAGVDYIAHSGTETIAAGELSVTVTVRTLHDSLDEFDEEVLLTISNIVSDVSAELDTVRGNSAVGLIVDDDEPPGVRIANADADEGGTLTFVIELDSPSGRPASIDFGTRDDSAVANDDYGPRSGMVSFATGQTRATVDVAALADDEPESDELFFVDLTVRSDGGLIIDKATGAGTIRDVSDRQVSVADAFAAEGDVLSFEVSFDGPLRGRDITIDYRTEAGSAVAGDDYDSTFETQSGTLRILAGQASAIVGIPTLQDPLDEDIERLRLVLSNPVGATLIDPDAMGVILDDDPEPSLSVDDVEATENDDGTPATFTVQLSEASGRTVTVDYSTLAGTAAAPGDYTAASGTLTLDAGDTSATVDVTLTDDDADEDIERFFLVLSGGQNAQLGDPQGSATVFDDDGLPQVVVDDPAPVREEPGAVVSFVVRLGGADAAGVVTVAYASESASAVAADDFVTQSGTLTFSLGQIQKVVTVPLVNDDAPEDTETFHLRLSNVSTSTATLEDDTATATVLDDDDLPKMSVDAASGVEGGVATFRISLSQSSAQAVTVDYAAVADASAGGTAAVPGLDFDIVSGTLTVPARAETATVTVPLADDQLDEHTETFWLQLADPDGATLLDATAVGTITDDDPLPQVSIDDTADTEGEELAFTVRLDTASGRTVTVPWSTLGRADTDPAAPGDDYVEASGTLTFASGTDSLEVEVTTVDDDIHETDETFNVLLGEPANAALDDNEAVGTIFDNDSLPRISIADTELLESESPATFTVTLSRPSSQAVTVDYETADGTIGEAAEEPGDYEHDARTLTIPAGFTEGEISIYVVDDDVDEEVETFHVSLSNPVGAVIAAGQGRATGYIYDNEQLRVSIGDAEAQESDGTIEFAVTLNHASTNDVTVRYATFDGTATQPDDYVATAGTLTITAGDRSGTIAVPLTDDDFVESTESFLVRLSNPTGAETDVDEALGVIVNDDGKPGFQVVDTRAREDEDFITWTVILDHVSNEEVSVDYQTSLRFESCDDAAPHGPHVSGRLVFPPGSTRMTVSLPLRDNDTHCVDSDHFISTWRVKIRLFDPSPNARVVNRFADGYIYDNEAYPNVEILNAFTSQWAAEHEGEVVVTLVMDIHNDLDVTVPYRVDDLDGFVATDTFTQVIIDNYRSFALATAGDDFTEVASGSVTIPAGSRFASFSVPIVDDNLQEPTESFVVHLESADKIGYSTDKDRTRGVIIDNDAVQVSVDDFEVIESAEFAQFQVRLDHASTQDVTLAYATADGSGVAPAVAPADYTAMSGSLRIVAGSTVAFVDVPLVDDADAETDETFSLTLSAVVGANVAQGKGTATATILDDDTGDPPVLSITANRQVEDGHTGDVCLDAVWRLNRPITASDGDGTGIVSFQYDFLAAPWLGDAAATPDDDFQILDSPGLVEIDATSGTNGKICVLITQDDIPENDEQFLVVLSNPMGVAFENSSALATIQDNDHPVVSVDDVSVAESAGVMTFTLQLHAPPIEPATVSYSTVVHSQSTDESATPDQDYVHTAGEATFGVGVTSVTVTVPITNDSRDEPDEAFLFVLSAPHLLSLRDSVAVGTITDDDPGWWIDDRSVWEHAGTMQFTVNRDHTSAAAVTLSYSVTGASAVGGTACTAGVDYVTPSGSVLVQPAQTQVTISLALCDDAVGEGRESFLVELLAREGRKLVGVGTIIDDDN